ncbi:Unknown protein [Striga hermonthica]|uniref:Uncharacterized protein n=1 Tax=Striga hermonthica TaxID=68872 RepID=A0A9N7RGK5_STRHE|nr:Unknown protein [Striga hermonthica]
MAAGESRRDRRVVVPAVGDLQPFCEDASGVASGGSGVVTVTGCKFRMVETKQGEAVARRSCGGRMAQAKRRNGGGRQRRDIGLLSKPQFPARVPSLSIVLLLTPPQSYYACVSYESAVEAAEEGMGWLLMAAPLRSDS